MNIKTYSKLNMTGAKSNTPNYNLYELAKNPIGSNYSMIIKNLSIINSHHFSSSIILRNVIIFITSLNVISEGSYTYNNITQSFSLSYISNFSSSYTLIDGRRSYSSYETDILTSNNDTISRPLTLFPLLVLSSSQRIMMGITSSVATFSVYYNTVEF